MTVLRRVFVVTLTVLLLSAAGAAAAPKLNLMNVESNFICVTCHEPLELVSSPQAMAEKHYLQSLIDQGMSLPAIKQQMVAAYGEAVLARPPAQGLNLLIYILPPAVLIFGLALLAYLLPRWRKRTANAGSGTSAGDDASVGDLDEADQQRLSAELDAF